MLAAVALAFLTVVPPATVDFSYVDNRMVVECRINGKGPFAMIVDTGAPVVAITPETALAIGVVSRANGSVSGAGAKRVNVGATRVTTLSLGSLTFRNLETEVIDLSQIRKKLGFRRLDGIIGYPILRRYAVVVDADRRTLRFAKAAPRVPADATTTPFAGVTPEVAARIDGIPARVILDTGDRSSLTLFGPFARAHRFYGRYPSRAHIVTGYGIGGPIYADVFTLPSVYLFGSRLSNVVTRASRQTGGVFTGADQGGSIGTGVLKRFNLVYDYPNKRIIAWHSRFFATPDRFVPPGR